MSSPDPEKLERLIHQTLRALPDRPAPSTLEVSVVAALGRRAGLPWWRRSYAQWPLSLRVAFLLLAAAAAAALVAFGRRPVTARAFGQVALSFPWIAFLQSVGASLMDTARIVFDAIPAAWIYSTVVLLAGCYALLIGLGAAVYRTYFHRRSALRSLSQ
jgi:hypothetical protein